MAARLQLPIIGLRPGDQFWIEGLAEQNQMFGFPPSAAFTPTRWLQDGDSVTVGHCRLDVRHCPGHAPGHVVFHSPEIGRTDFPQGDHDSFGRERKSNPYVGGT